MITFKMSPHQLRNVWIVEIWKDKKLVGTINPNEDSISIISGYVAWNGHTKVKLPLASKGGEPTDVVTVVVRFEE
jgi:hypothetical protein